MMLKATLDIMKLCEERYQARGSLFNPTDPRMVCVEVAIHTWILKFAGIVESEYNAKLTAEDPWQEFRDLYEKIKHQLLNDDEWARLKKGMMELAQTVLRAADVIIATAVQGETDLLKKIFFNQVIMDEVTVATHGELRPIVRTKKFVIRVEDTPAGPVQSATAPPVQIISSEIPSEYGHFSYLQHATTVTKSARIRILSTKSQRDSTRLVCANYHRRARQCTTPSTPKSSSDAQQNQPSAVTSTRKLMARRRTFSRLIQFQH